MRDRRKVVEQRLRALGKPRHPHRVPPPEGRLSPDEQPAERLPGVLASLGPVFADFGRYLSSRIDLLPRRDCLELAGNDPGGWEWDDDAGVHASDVTALVREQLDEASDGFHEIDPAPRTLTAWTQQHNAWFASSVPVAVRIVRPDADQLLSTDLPLLHLLKPWLDMPANALPGAIADFSQTLRQRLDQTEQAAALVKLAEDAEAGGTLDAPVCYRDYCATRILTIERVGGAAIADAIDRETAARRLASAWLRQALTGRVVPFDFDLGDLHVRDGRLVLAGGVLEPQTATERERFLAYLVAVAGDDPDGAWDWIAEAAVPGPEAESEYRLRTRLRQAVPFRDGEWSGDDRFGERLLVQWRVVREAGWRVRPHQLHLYRGIQAITAATTRLAPDRDVFLAALEDERLRLGMAGVRRLMSGRGIVDASDQVLQDMAHLPQKLDEFLSMAAEGRLRVKLHIPDSEDGRRVKNRTVSLLASLVTLVGIAFLVRHLAPTYGPSVERIGALLLLIVGGWLLIAAARE